LKVGDDVADVAVDAGIATGIDIGRRGVRLIGEAMVACGSRRYGIEGETARRLDAGYGSKRSSTGRLGQQLPKFAMHDNSRLRLLGRIAAEVGGGV
jgi:hypothetical protein